MLKFSNNKAYPSLAISEDKIQLLQLDKSRKSVVGLAEIKLDPDIVESGEVKDQAKLAQAIKSLLQSAKNTEKFFIIGIPEYKSYTKVLRLPKLKADELAEAVSWEAETYLPVPLEQLYMDWKVISKDKENILILLIAVPQEIINGYTEVLKQIDITPVAFETTALSLVRLVQDRNTRILAIQVDGQNAVLILTRGESIEASSIVSFKKIAQKNQVSELISTVNKMLNYYEQGQADDNKVKTIVVCGEAVSKELLDEIQKNTSRKVELCPAPVKNLPQENVQNFVLVASLAMKRVEAPEAQDTINLLPPNIQASYDQYYLEKRNRKLLIASTLVMSFCTLFSLVSFLYLLSSFSSLEKEKLTLESLPPETGEAVKQTNALNQSARTVVEVNYQRIFSHTRLMDIVPNIPQDVLVKSINIDELQNKIQIVAIAKTRADMLHFRDNLESQGKFTEATLPLSSLQKAENIDFVLTARMKNYETK